LSQLEARLNAPSDPVDVSSRVRQRSSTEETSSIMIVRTMLMILPKLA
jgi:hypothetical protein